MALSALLCAVCRGGVECKLYENKRNEGKRVAGGPWAGGRLKNRERMGAKILKGVSWERVLGVLRQIENTVN